MFDPKWEQLGDGPLWVRLPELLLHFWFDDILKRIGNALVTYIDHDKSYGNMSLARILIHLDTREGLEEQITLH